MSFVILFFFNFFSYLKGCSFKISKLNIVVKPIKQNEKEGSMNNKNLIVDGCKNLIWWRAWNCSIYIYIYIYISSFIAKN